MPIHNCLFSRTAYSDKLPIFLNYLFKVGVLCPVRHARVILGQVLSIFTCGSQTHTEVTGLSHQTCLGHSLETTLFIIILSFISRRRIFPLADFGICSTKAIPPCSCLKDATCSKTETPNRSPRIGTTAIITAK